MAVAVGLAALTSGGCAEHSQRHEHDRDTPACTAPPFAAQYWAIDPCSPDAVLIAATDAIFNSQPDRQYDSAESFYAAASLVAPGYLQRIGASAIAWTPIPTATWARWSSQRISVTAAARITADDHPADTRSQSSRVIAVTQHPGDEPPRAFTVYAQATRDGSNRPWLVTNLEVR
ncbi:hypothetical protein IU500_24665 [Nocardia terpenica]|uniref:hypothetical protein n=1 Tax=Nocardia terpenica TaxID=455432 RepID=UPI0018963118|nr:hypothetical protein [Nocardia terpenica]MBF6064694.1 hypothetical protein [Nocardia terpenica]MBF6107210.1 hypothetical protein [Nocardia terpenica]MBF6114968.1 hypothetical protein [Nocardia terpenica]MBF6122073.1 hypothetical protein [Nocardia terpenica]MBF6154456.1 hypothetical protein [Nocardia terpenica]